MTTTDNATIARISRNDQAITRAFDLAAQVNAHRAMLLQSKIPEDLANQMAMVLHAHLMRATFGGSMAVSVVQSFVPGSSTIEYEAAEVKG